MAKPLIITKLIKSVRDRAMIPDDTSTYTDQDIIDILNEEMDVGLLKVIMSLNEEHFVTHIDVEIDEDGAVPIPSRAIGNKLRDVAYISSGEIYEMSRISIEELSDYRNDISSYQEEVFYIEGDEVKLVSGSTQFSNTLRMYFYLRPNNLVLEKECARINSINTTTGRVQLDTFPSNFTGEGTFDFIQAKAPNKILAYDLSETNRDATLKFIDFDPADLPKRLKVGDYLCVESTSPYANIPSEMQPLLAQRAACFILEALGDTEGLQNALRKMAQMENSLQTIIEDRVEGAPQKINSRHTTLKQTVRHFGNRNRRRRR